MVHKRSAALFNGSAVMATHSEVAAARTLVVWCPDWPVVAAVMAGEVTGAEPWDRPIAVVHANRVVAVSGKARVSGVRRGMRRREAQACCPDVDVISADPNRDARFFEPIVAAVSAYSPVLEIATPGVCQLATRGPSRYFGGDESLVETMVGAVAAQGVAARVGIAEGPFAAQLAARATTATAPWRIIEPGRTPDFLAPLPVATVARAVDDVDFGGLLLRLGIRTLEQLAGLPSTDVAARFGPIGERARRLAAGLDPDAVRPTPVPPDLAVGQEFEAPLERIDAAAFVARALAEELHGELTVRGLACACIRIEARFDDGTEMARRWRHERAGAPGGLTPAALGDRVRWQLDGWLLSRRGAHNSRENGSHDRGDGIGGSDGGRNGGGIVQLRLVPEEVMAEAGRQLGLWGTSEADERADRAFARVQGLLGPEAVMVPEVSGGRGPDGGVRFLAWGDARDGQSSPGRRGRGRTRKPGRTPAIHDSSLRGRESDRPSPWPGRLPTPLPALLHEPALPAEVLDASGQRVRVTGRGMCSAEPAFFVRAGRRESVVGWAGPWPVEERWWDLATGRRQARFQIQTASGAWLVVLEVGAWWVTAAYA